MPIANGAVPYIKPNSILKIASDWKQASGENYNGGSYFEGDFCYFDTKEKIPKKEPFDEWVQKQKAAGLKVMYKNRDGSKGGIK